MTKGGFSHMTKANPLLSEWWKNMMEALSWRFYENLAPFNMLTIKGCCETVFFESDLSKSFIVCNFRNKAAMTIIYFSKGLKFDVDSRYWTKESIKVFGF